MPIHPVYGAYENGWKQVPGFENYEVNEHSHVRNKNRQKVLKHDCDQSVDLRKDKQRFQKRVYHVCLLAFFPSVQPLETVDHIDENHKNNFIENLQWMGRGANASKSCKLKPRITWSSRSKAVQQFTLEGKFVRDYVSVQDTVRTAKLHATVLLDCLNNRRTDYRGFCWKFKDQPDLPGEQWTTSENLIKYLQEYGFSDSASQAVQISNLGRVLTSRGIKTKGTIFGQYRRYNSMLVHILVWLAWGNKVPNGGEFVLHDDSQPCDEDGCVSNSFVHLHLGSQKDNMQECNAVGKLAKHYAEKRKAKSDTVQPRKRRKLN
jgi:hypothetical protein